MTPSADKENTRTSDVQRATIQKTAFYSNMTGPSS
jgi:hypothetical protein